MSCLGGTGSGQNQIFAFREVILSALFRST
jgi:hypothetical protein